MTALAKTFVLRDEFSARNLWAFLKNNWPQMAQAGKPLAISIKEHRAKRSTDQNAKLHALLTEISEQAWVGGRQYSVETWKEQVRRQFIGTEEIDMPDGTRIERGISTTTLNVEEFSLLIEKVMHWAATELQVEVV